jgi:integrase
MVDRHREVQDVEAHSAATALTRGETCCLPDGYTPSSRHPDRRPVATSATWQPRRQAEARLVGTPRPQRPTEQDHPPRLEAIGLPASRPQRTADDGTAIPATKGVRLHDLRHTAAVLWLSNGVHFIQVAKWLGHSSYVLTLTTYADYIPEVEVENTLPEPVAPVARANVVNLFG